MRDPYAKAVCGVGCTGNIRTKGKYRPFYSIWHDMINRCYNPNDKRYSAYCDVTVSESWLIFENFYNDVKEIDGYDEEKISSGSLVLDKDHKQRFVKNKVYSKETCLWIDKTLNNQVQDSQQRPFIATSPAGEKYHDYNITRFAHEHGLRRRNVSNVLHGKGKTVAGWKFTYEEIV